MHTVAKRKYDTMHTSYTPKRVSDSASTTLARTSRSLSMPSKRAMATPIKMKKSMAKENTPQKTQLGPVNIVISMPVLSKSNKTTTSLTYAKRITRHCVGGSSENTCTNTKRDYNVPLRVGLLFVILVTSAIGVFMPILTTRFNLISQNNIVFVVLKQFGTGIVISTAFVHLFTHAELMFGNECLGTLQYEGTTAAIFMAGLFLSFVIDYAGARFVQWRLNKRIASSAEVPTSRTADDDKSAGTSSSTPENEFVHSHGHAHGSVRTATPMEEKINVMNLEAGIIFHSIRKHTFIKSFKIITNESQ